jgi:hypothetical protein
MTQDGQVISSLEVPNSSDIGIKSNSDQMVTSFSSKSEVALNLSTDKSLVTFMGYAPIDALDVSNSNTPFVVDPTNPVSASYYRVVAQVDQHGKFLFTKTNAYSGNNGRAAILNNTNGANHVYTSGNAGNGTNPQPNGVIVSADAQILNGANKPLNAQKDPGLPTPVGSFNIAQLGDKADKIGKEYALSRQACGSRWLFGERDYRLQILSLLASALSSAGPRAIWRKTRIAAVLSPQMGFWLRPPQLLAR